MIPRAMLSLWLVYAGIAPAQAESMGAFVDCLPVFDRIRIRLGRTMAFRGALEGVDVIDVAS